MARALRGELLEYDENWVPSVIDDPEILKYYRVSRDADGNINGIMSIGRGPYSDRGLYVATLQGIGTGGGTTLLKSAIQESMEQGYGGEIYLSPIKSAFSKYEQLGGTYVEERNIFYWDENTIHNILNQ